MNRNSSIKLYNDDSLLFQRESFILIKPFSSFYKVGNRYDFIDHGTDTFLGRRLLKFKQDFALKDIPEEYTWLTKNVHRTLYIEIQRSQWNTKDTDMFSVLIFSNRETEEYIHQQQELIFNRL